MPGVQRTVGGTPTRTLVCDMPGCTLAVDYSANTGRVNGLFVANGTGRPVYAEARFDAPVGGSAVWSQTFDPGDTLLALPSSAVSVVSYLDADGQTQRRVSPEAAISLTVPG
jgi:hypothetical protein